MTVNTTGKAGNLLIARASSFVGAENLESWTAQLDGRNYRFVVSGNGLYLRIESGLHIIVR